MTSYWWWWGTMMLAYLTYQDLKNQRRVDDRRNWFMMGLTLSLISHLPISLWYLMLMIIIIISANIVYNNRLKNKLGKADFNTFQWSMTGMAIINPIITLAYIGILSFLSGAYMIISKKYHKEVMPYYPVIIIGFVITGIIFGGYL